jgi:toxin ParE1/3/4
MPPAKRVRVYRTKRARDDLLDIWTFIAAEDPSAADSQLDRIDEQCQGLADNPHLGPRRDDVRPGMRYLVVGTYLILYRVVDGDVEIVRIIHGRRDLFALL